MIFSLIIPCCNEEENINAMYDAVMKTFKNCGFDYEMVFINDGSSDKTAEKIRKLCKENFEKIIFIDFSRNFGKEAAIFAGLENCSGDYAVIIDGDLQQPPETALEMVNFLIEHPEYDCVTAYQEKRIENKFTGFLKECFYKLVNKVSEVNFVENASDFRTMKRNMIDAVLSMRESIRFSKGIFAWAGFRTHYIPYVPKERNAGETKWSVKKLFKYAFDGTVAFSTKILKLPFFLSVCSFIFSLIYLAVRLSSGHFTEISLAVFLILFMSGVLLLGLSAIAVYLRCMYIESKNRPIYIAREIINNQKNNK